MRVDISAGKGTSGMDRFDSVIDRINMKLGSKFLKSLGYIFYSLNSQDPVP